MFTLLSMPIIDSSSNIGNTVTIMSVHSTARAQFMDVDGLSLLAAIEKEPATRRTPVLALSATGSDQASGDPGPLVATAMAGGFVASAMTGGTGWEHLASLLGRIAPGTDGQQLALPSPLGRRPGVGTADREEQM